MTKPTKGHFRFKPSPEEKKKSAAVISQENNTFAQFIEENKKVSRRPLTTITNTPITPPRTPERNSPATALTAQTPDGSTLKANRTVTIEKENKITGSPAHSYNVALFSPDDSYKKKSSAPNIPNVARPLFNDDNDDDDIKKKGAPFLVTPESIGVRAKKLSGLKKKNLLFTKSTKGYEKKSTIKRSVSQNTVMGKSAKDHYEKIFGAGTTKNNPQEWGHITAFSLSRGTTNPQDAKNLCCMPTWINTNMMVPEALAKRLTLSYQGLKVTIDPKILVNKDNIVIKVTYRVIVDKDDIKLTITFDSMHANSKPNLAAASDITQLLKIITGLIFKETPNNHGIINRCEVSKKNLMAAI